MPAQKIHSSAQIGFSQAAELYQKTRPSYPEEIILWLQHTLGLNPQSYVVDLGSGTGKFIPYLQSVTHNIHAIEPVAEMRAQLQSQYPTIQSTQTDSRALGIPAASIDAVICAQSFHWFSDLESLNAIHEILKPQAHLGLVWNQRDTSIPWVKEIADFLLDFEGDTPRYHTGQWQKVFDNSKLFKLKSCENFSLHHRGTIEQVVIQRLLSTSFIAAMPPDLKAYIQYNLIHIVKKHLQKDLNEIIDFPYITYAYDYQKI